MKFVSLFAFVLVSHSAFAFDQPPAPILNGGTLAIDQVALVEHFTPATGEFLAQHSVDVVVSGVFQLMCGGLQSIIKFERADARTNSYAFTLSGGFQTIRCMAIGLPVRKTFVVDSISLAPNEQLPFVSVNGIRGVRSAAR